MSSLGNTLRQATTNSSLDPKRTHTEKTGVHGWFPYYAGYASRFVEHILQSLFEEHGSLRVLDPWNGSGTTSLIAHQVGHKAYGFDINPVLSIISAAKIASPEKLSFSELAQLLNDKEPVPIQADDPLHAWLDITVIAEYRRIEDIIFTKFSLNKGGDRKHIATDSIPSMAAFLLFALMKTARTYAKVKKGSNPTWIRPSSESRVLDVNLGEAWLSQLDSMAHDLSKTAGSVTWMGHLGVADSRNLPLTDDSIDVILTSPPYCTRIDYIISSSFELAALRGTQTELEFRDLRKASMGTPLSRQKSSSNIPSDWPKTVKEVLEAIREHPSKASKTYYYRTYWQYFEDVMRSLTELRRVMKIGGVGALVVQSSYYKDIPIDLPRLYVDFAENLGLKAEVTLSLDIRRSMAQINTASKKHQASKKYREGVITFERIS